MKLQGSTLTPQVVDVDLVLDKASLAAVSARRAQAERRRVSDADMDALVASWQLRHGPSAGDLNGTQFLASDDHGAIVIEVGTAMVLSKLTEKRGRKGWLDSRREEVVGDARIWVIDQLSEFRSGKGSAGAYLASRLDWIVGDLLRTHGQGAGVLDRNAYQVRAAMWNVLADRKAAGLDISPVALRAATLEHLCADMVAKAIAEGVDANAAQLRAVASLKKAGKYAALDRIGEFLTVGDNDLSLEQPLADGMTVADVVADEFSEAAGPGELDEEDGLTQMYRVALGDRRWAEPVLAARLGMLGSLEGIATIDVEDGISTSRPSSVPNLAAATGRDREEIRRVMTDAPVRLGSPHAHFAHLSAPVLHAAPVTVLGGFDLSVFSDN